MIADWVAAAVTDAGFSESPKVIEGGSISSAVALWRRRIPTHVVVFDAEGTYRLTLTEVNQMLSTTLIEERERMALFQMEKPVSAFVVDGVTFCGKDVILEMERSIYRGDKYRFSVRAT